MVAGEPLQERATNVTGTRLGTRCGNVDGYECEMLWESIRRTIHCFPLQQVRLHKDRRWRETLQRPYVRIQARTVDVEPLQDPEGGAVLPCALVTLEQDIPGKFRRTCLNAEP
jgi:hypothetical protein